MKFNHKLYGICILLENTMLKKCPYPESICFKKLNSNRIQVSSFTDAGYIPSYSVLKKLNYTL